MIKAASHSHPFFLQSYHLAILLRTKWCHLRDLFSQKSVPFSTMLSTRKNLQTLKEFQRLKNYIASHLKQFCVKQVWNLLFVIKEKSYQYVSENFYLYMEHTAYITFCHVLCYIHSSKIWAGHFLL